jgi:hypothetical protein
MPKEGIDINIPKDLKAEDLVKMVGKPEDIIKMAGKALNREQK